MTCVLIISIVYAARHCLTVPRVPVNSRLKIEMWTNQLGMNARFEWQILTICMLKFAHRSAGTMRCRVHSTSGLWLNWYNTERKRSPTIPVVCIWCKRFCMKMNFHENVRMIIPIFFFLCDRFNQLVWLAMYWKK